MRVFQIGHIYPRQGALLAPQLKAHFGYEAARHVLIENVPKAQILKPCLDGDTAAFLSYHQEPHTMRLWAAEKGLRPNISVDDILLAQIEEHRTEVLYNVHGSAMPASLIRRLPGCVRLKLAWLGSLLTHKGYSLYDALLSSFPLLNASHKALGLRAEYFIFSYDPTPEALGDPGERDIDVLFTGVYSRHHRKRARLLRHLAEAARELRVVVHLDQSRYTRLAETPLGWFPPLSAVRRPKAVRRIAQPPVFGLDMFRALSRARIVINMAGDMARTDRGNMRCFETLSAGALLLSDAGNYPEGFRDGDTMVTYETAEEAIGKARGLLEAPERCEAIAKNGHAMLKRDYSKDRQWILFKELCARLK